MSDLLQTGSDWLAGKFKAYASRLVKYKRGAITISASVSATIGRTVFDQIGLEGVYYERIETRDYLIQVADLSFPISGTTPAVGDIIEETEGTTIYQYEVLSIPNEPHWRYSDAYRQVYRIHTKLKAD